MPPVRHHVVVVRGPGLISEGAEVSPVAQMYQDVTVLGDGSATAKAVLGGNWGQFFRDWTYQAAWSCLCPLQESC